MTKLNWSKFNKPMFTPVIDRFIILGLLMIMSSLRIFAGDFFRSWQGLLTILLGSVVIVVFLMYVGKQWREKRGISDEDIKPNEKTEKIFMNIAVGISAFFFIGLLILNVVAFDSFNWALFLLTGSILILCLGIRFIRGKRLENNATTE
ncbi:hypothetical protein [Alkalicoccobacillus porphyridii]|uniref:Uncharacterized protein n=1 Tax=Alkalicoccobacillus porphyridii TaxID=2597270 RepID=A0A554A205_9BACI|nr:hypothetical protein [Alkalicoccobacillus porphyridii]TSB47731.1 hypothetical protein FN960_04225 [Alkalicoccobacillus porphyridii]